jgi:hypothetical protein
MSFSKHTSSSFGLNAPSRCTQQNKKLEAVLALQQNFHGAEQQWETRIVAKGGGTDRETRGDVTRMASISRYKVPRGGQLMDVCIGAPTSHADPLVVSVSI